MSKSYRTLLVYVMHNVNNMNLREKIKEAKYILFITHTDLDGAGCAIAFNYALQFNEHAPNVERHYIGYDMIDDLVSDRLLENKINYDLIIFADMSPSEHLGKALLEDERVHIIDHHKSRDYLSNNIANVCFDERNSATFLFWQLLHAGNVEVYKHTVNQIDAWDSWKLDSPYRKTGVLLNYYFKKLGIDLFVQSFADFRQFTAEEEIEATGLKIKEETEISEILLTGKLKIDEDKRFFLAIEAKKHYPMGIAVILMRDNTKYDKVEYIEVYTDIDGVKKVSLYSDGKVDVSEIAKKHGGGGHKGAGGYIIK